MNPFNITSYKIGKLSSVDIKAKTNDGRTIIVEVQRQSHTSFADLTLYYWAYNYRKQLKSSESYTSLNPVVCINLLNFSFLPEINDFHTCFHITEMNRPEYILTEHLHIHFIELSKLTFETGSLSFFGMLTPLTDTVYHRS